MPEKIDLFIVGAQKAGTSSLKNYLGEHPEISTHYSQEFSFFYDDNEFAKGEKYAFEKFFRLNSESKVRIAKHAHLYSSEKAIKRLYEHNPKCKIIFILRNPVERTLSSYQLEKLYNRVNFKFEELVLSLDGSFPLKLERWQREAIVEFGYYEKFLPYLNRFFPKEQISLILFDEFQLNPLEIVQNIFRELNVRPEYHPRIRTIHNETAVPRFHFLSTFLKNYLVSNNQVKSNFSRIIPTNVRIKIGEVIRNINRSKKGKIELSEKVIVLLKKHFQSHIVELERISGLNLNNWK